MIATKEIHSNGFYIFASQASANSNYIENLEEARQLLVYARYYLKSYIIIHDYVITRHGWQFAVTLNPISLDNSQEVEVDLWKIISERIRLFISTYVRRVNFSRNRRGVLVRNNYTKYYFETLGEATSHLNKMRNQRVKLYQKEKKYRGIKFHYRIEKEIEKGSIFLCSKEMRSGKKEVREFLRDQLFWDFRDLVGLDLINSTRSSHQSSKSTASNQNSS